ncbi:hypothetical protein I314_03601 [Cryptococcus bacillisporus CA1873]|uniref:Vps72/YL1 C-terminal domain-containing protein n=1 Tax=Cryptococcus bacillisporus CA1873 TaxID=1296111 RepID=A0ABR5B9Q4_CRYGA|nr:hypothetical protein I314_03601 [Cryptococcus bacillisporus CA1873]|eukprot:KIR60310.1 hypothetical protein I314_03601 [Cryptococcus gattii CA1873]
MPEYETITQGRARRSTAGNRMRELLEKAHQEDEDELFKEVEDDEEFVAPPEQKDVFLDEFADTDSAPSDEDEEAQVLRAERRAKRDAQAKGKSKSKVNPLTAPKYGYGYGAKAKEQGFKLKESDLALLGQDVDVASMAPSTLVLELRRRKREAKRVNRSEARRSNLRASTLATAAAAATDPDAAQGEADAEEDDGKNKGRRGRVAQHIAATRTIRKPLTQSQLIEAALEEEERNKEALRDWLKKEEEKRELRRVGRKVVKGPRWTWVSRTVGRLVEEIPEPAEAEKGEESELNGEGKQEARLDEAEERQGEQEKPQGEAEKSQGETSPKTPAPPSEEQSKVPTPPSAEKAATETTLTPLNPPAPPEQQQQQQSTETQTQPPPPAQSETNAPYTRNYIILSQIPGGLPAELQVVLGSHVEWDKLKVIPSRNRPINRQIPLCPFTNLPAKYRHPTTLIPFATKDGYQAIEALLLNRYEWVEQGGWWGAGEGDVWADGMEAVEGLDKGFGIGGWYAGERLGPPESQHVKEEEVEESEAEAEAEAEIGIGIGIEETTPTDGKMEEEAETGTKKRARQSEGEAEARKKAAKSKRRR